MDISFMQVQKQKQALCQSQINSLQILTMNNVELKEFLQAEQMENPLLEIPETDSEDLFAVGRWFKDKDRAYASRHDDEQDAQYDIPDRSDTSLSDYLKGQIPYHALTSAETSLLCDIIDLLDADTGFLTTPVKEIVYLSGAALDKVVKCVKILRSMEPAGIGAENLRQCLIIQAERLGHDDKILFDLIKYHLEDIAGKRYKKIAAELDISRQQLTNYIALVKSLNPRPSRGFGDYTAEYIVPDVLINFYCGKWSVTLNDRWIGSVGINKLYKSYVSNAEDESVREYLRGKIDQAKFIIKCIEQRRDTLIKISDCILKKQLDYISGAGYLKAMNLNDVAQELSIHCSTVSRTIKGKYIQTPRGIYSFKHFFVGKTAPHSEQEDDSAISSAKARAVLNEIISGENKSAPLSDSAICREMEKYGITLSRRTVAKYRQMLGLPNAAERQLI